MSLGDNLGSMVHATPGIDPAAVKALRSSLEGKLLGRTAAMLALVVLLLGVANLANAGLARLGLVLSPAWLNSALLIGVPSLVIFAQLLNEVRAERDRREATALAIKPAAVPENYFRIGPYLDTESDRKAFIRADRAHEKVLDWLLASACVPLYLTGDSGAGKTSLLSAFVLPSMRKDGWTIVQLRVGQDAEAALRRALTPPDGAPSDSVRDLLAAAVQRCGGRFLLVLDQFEEFVTLGTADSQQAFAAVLDDLRARTLAGLKVLLVVRTDYQTALEEAGLPQLRQGENFFPVGRFREQTARTFMKASKLGLKDETLDRLLKSAAELDDTPGMIRPITLNVLGYVLREHGGAVADTVDAGQIVRGYIEQTVENPAIRAWSPAVLAGLLTEQGTKRPRAEADLAASARLRPAEVRAVMNALANAALARPLEGGHGVWELSHDFVARAVHTYLGLRRRALIRTILAYSAPALLVLGIIALVGSIAWRRLEPGQLEAELLGMGVTVETVNGSVVAGTTGNFKPEYLPAAVPLLGRLAVDELDLSGTHVANLEPLKGLPALQTLGLSVTHVANLEPLKGLSALQTLYLSGTQVANLEPLKGLSALRTLGLDNTQVANLEPLKGLSALRTLGLDNTQVANLEPLKGLPALQTLSRW